MSSKVTQQRRIIDWFDDVYRRQGERYLRPLRAYYLFLELLQAKSGDHLLDVGCGLGRLIEAAKEYGVVTQGIDASQVAVEKARQKFPESRIVCANAEDMPYPNDTFDLVTCIGSLERMLNMEHALAEMRRVGKPSARFCFMVRNSETLSWRFQCLVPSRRNDGHAGADTLANWRELFEGSGFVVRAVWPDQYPLQKRKRRRSLFIRKVDFRRPIDTKLARANEFIFLLGKRH